MVTLEELRAACAKLEKSIAHDKQNVASENFELRAVGQAFLRKHERELEITQLAIKALEAGL